MKNNIKPLVFFNTFKDIIEKFGEMEVGCSEVDVESLANYLTSDKFFFESLDYNSEEESQQFVTNYILNGFPVWKFLKCSEWTKKMLEKSFICECQEESNMLKNTYCCFSCEYFKQSETSIGIFQKCIKPKKIRSLKRDPFTLRKTCTNFVKKENKNETL